MKFKINKMLKISAFYLEKQKSFVPKKICGMLLIETLKSKLSDFLNSNTYFCSRLYGTYLDVRSAFIINFMLPLVSEF
jgi:hypothetical protein